MDKLEFGKTGLWVSKIAMGGIPIMRLRKKEAADVVRKVLDVGINFIDTPLVATAIVRKKLGKHSKERKGKIWLLPPNHLPRIRRHFWNMWI